VSWASKKQNFVALSIVEGEYIAAGHCCAQLLWMRQLTNVNKPTLGSMVTN
jgi:hypothetical protein